MRLRVVLPLLWMMSAACSQDGVAPVRAQPPGGGATPAPASAPTAAPKSTPPPAATQWNGAAIAWHTFAAGQAEAQRSGKPMLAVFKGEWCRQCKKYRQLFSDPRVVKLSEKFVMVLADDKRDAEASRSHMPDGGYVPRTMFFAPDGQLDEGLRGRHPRYAHFLNNRDASELLGLMQRAAGQYGS